MLGSSAATSGETAASAHDDMHRTMTAMTNDNDKTFLVFIGNCTSVKILWMPNFNSDCKISMFFHVYCYNLFSNIYFIKERTK